MKKQFAIFILVLMFVGCSGMSRGCSSFWAENAGANWVIVQYGYNGDPINCWKLQNVSITNESGSDGIYWKDESGHLVHISGWYNRVQVDGGRYEEAAELLGVEISKIKNGKYPKQ